MRYQLWELLGPLSWSLWALVFALVALMRRRNPRLWMGLAILLQLAVAMPVVGRWLITPLEMRYPLPALAEAPGTIVVLAGAERLTQSAIFKRPILSEASERVSEAAYLARRFPAARIVLVGGIVGLNGIRDVDIAAQFLGDVGVAPGRLVIVSNTTDTCTNASGFAKTSQQAPTVLVTSAAHMPRAMACFAAAGLTPIPYPVDFRGMAGRSGGALFMPGGSTNAATVDLALHEWAGLAWYRLSGRTVQLMP